MGPFHLSPLKLYNAESVIFRTASAKHTDLKFPDKEIQFSPLKKGKMKKECLTLLQHQYDAFAIHHNFLLDVYLIYIIFFWNFGIVLATQFFFLCFHRLTKPTTFKPAAMANPLFAQNVLVWHLYSVQFSSLTFFLGSMSKGFRVLKSGNSVSDSELSEQVLELLSEMWQTLFFLHMVIKSKCKIYLMLKIFKLILIFKLIEIFKMTQMLKIWIKFCKENPTKLFETSKYKCNNK